MDTRLIKREVEDSPFHIFFKPILENLLSPLFGYILAYAAYQVYSQSFYGTFASVYDSSLTTFCTYIAYIVLAIAAALTTVRYLHDDALIFLGKMTQQVSVQRLESENARLKEQIRKLREDKENGRHNGIGASGGYTISNADLLVDDILENEPVVLDTPDQLVYDNALVLYQRLGEGVSIKRDDVVRETELSQRQWKKARDLLIELQIITSDNAMIIFDKPTVENLVNDFLVGAYNG